MRIGVDNATTSYGIHFIPMRGRIGVLGHKGVLGREIIRILSKKSLPVIAVGLDVDITDAKAVRDALRNVDGLVGLVNCAAIVPVQEVESNLLNSYKVNALGPSISFVEFANHVAGRQSKVRPFFIHVSSSHVYEKSRLAITENSLARPSNSYGATKLLGDSNLIEISKETNVRTVIARVFSMYSENQPVGFLYPNVIRLAGEKDLSKDPLTIYGGHNVRDFTSAEDVARRILLLVKSDFAGVINVGSGVAQSVVQFATAVTGADFRADPTVPGDPSDSLYADISLLKKLEEGLPFE